MSTRTNRETAYRVFAAEFDDASLSYAESDEERAPNYVLTPTGARINRLFAVGVLTEIESVNDEQLRARIVDPTGAFVVYAGQYQPDALSFLERAETPAFVAVTGKARTFQPEDSNRVFTSIRPETLSEVDATTRDRFTVDAAERTAERVQVMQEALERDERDDALREALEAEGVEAGLAAGVPRAIAHYGTTPAYLDAVREMALDAARVVAGEREEAPPLGVAPNDGGPADRLAPADSDETDSRDESTAPMAESADETEPESTADEAAVADDAERAVENESAVETDEPTTAQPTAEPERPNADIESEGGAGDAPGRTDEPVEATESSVGSGQTDDTPTETDLDDPEEFELDAEEREHIEDQYGTDFESAAEVDGPGEADIETPMPDEPSTDASEESESLGMEDAEAAESAGTVESATSETPSAETDTMDEPAGEGTDTDSDPEEAVVAAMREFDDGDGADREAVIESVVEDGLTREDAEDGIQEALMSGECYEPDDDTLKPI